MRTPRRLISASRSCSRRSGSSRCRSPGCVHTARVVATSVTQRACTEFELGRVLVPAAAFLARARDLAQRLDRLGVLAVGQTERLRQQSELGGMGVGERQAHRAVPALERDRRKAEARGEDQLAERPLEFPVVDDDDPSRRGRDCEERCRIGSPWRQVCTSPSSTAQHINSGSVLGSAQ